MLSASHFSNFLTFHQKQLERHVCLIIAHHSSFNNSTLLVRVIVKVSTFSRHVRSRLVVRARAVFISSAEE
jgi:hypothetical protein